MAGHLQVHPYFRTYDELQRSIKRMNVYLDQNRNILDDATIAEIEEMIENMELAIGSIPQEYRKTKFKYSK